MLNHFFHSHHSQHKPHSSSHRKKEYDFGPPNTQPIGQGGSGQVMKATWKANGGMCVAVKVVRKEAVMEEAEYLKILDGFERICSNKNICCILDWFQSTHKYYLIFPLLTGGELLERLNENGRFTEEAVRRIVGRILDTLTYIHSHGIIHRDIKPDNFLYRSKDAPVEDVVLIDFGISKILDRNTDGDDSYDDDDPKIQTQVAGTPGYAAPEVFLKTGYGKNQDVFGVGVIAYNLLSASTPWKSKSYGDLIRESMSPDVQFPAGPFRGVSEEAKTFVRCLMNVNPHVRPSSREALQHPWLSTRRPSVTKRIPIPTTGNTVEIEIHHSPSSPEDQFGRTPVEPITTLKPDHPVARQITALGYQELS